jgi:hypothetical protein
VYASTFGRSGPQKQRIEAQIEGMFNQSAHVVTAHLDIEYCAKLLDDYGTILASR